MGRNDKRPVSYTDWRRLYHSVSRNLGWHVFWCWQHKRPLLDRSTWILLYRLNRIWDRLQVEGEVKDESWCEAMFEMIFHEKPPT